MLKLKVWNYEDGRPYCDELRNLRPRRYMCGWDFERIYKYAREELEWEDIKLENISGFVFVERGEHWEVNVTNPNFKRPEKTIYYYYKNAGDTYCELDTMPQGLIKGDIVQEYDDYKLGIHFIQLRENYQ